MKCFYHSADLDGRCSGAIINKRFPTCKLYGFDYGNEFPWKEIEEGEKVFMVDVSLPIEDMKRLNKMVKLIWIDHHVSIIDIAQKEKFLAYEQLLEVGKAACELTWLYCYPHSSLPQAVHLLARYDVWDLYFDDILAFQYGIRTFDTQPEDYIWTVILHENSYCISIINKGENILEYIHKDNKNYVNSYGFKTTLNDYRAIAVNKGMGNSQLFNSIWNEKDYDIMIAFAWVAKLNKHRVSLYTTEETGIDVSQIAVLYGGGGHKQAAGFMCNYLPFSLVGYK